jgi:hypothetical protein
LQTDQQLALALQTADEALGPPDGRDQAGNAARKE